MKCLYCQKEIIGKRTGAKFCSPAHKRDYHRRGIIAVPQLTVSKGQNNRTNDTDKLNVSNENDTDNWVGLPDVEITPEVEKKLGQIYKNFEKENKGFMCIPCIVRGVRVLTEWEKMKLKSLDEEV